LPVSVIAISDEKSLLREVARHHLVQLLADRDIVDIGRGLERGVRDLVKLVAHALDHLRMAMAGVVDGDAGGKIDVALAFDVPQFGVLRLLDVDVEMFRQASRNGGSAPRRKGSVRGHGVSPWTVCYGAALIAALEVAGPIPDGRGRRINA
jgi:hypothetical protein